MSTTRSFTDRPMTADEFVAWAETRGEGERYELVRGEPERMQAEKVAHAERKAAVWLTLRNSLKAAGLDQCRAFIDGVSIWIDDETVREPDAVIHCGPYDPEDVFVDNPVVVVEVVSPSTAKTDIGRKILDYFAVPSILHYLIVYGRDEKVIHHRRASAEGEIVTALLGRDGVMDLTPPGIVVRVQEFFEA